MKLNDLRDERVPIVNGLLQKAFGFRFAGNFDGYEIPLSKTNKLVFIVNRRFLGLHKVIGQFDSDDGSSIRVLPEYASQARMYAEMFKTRFGKEVTVNLDSKANYKKMVSGMSSL